MSFFAAVEWIKITYCIVKLKSIFHLGAKNDYKQKDYNSFIDSDHADAEFEYSISDYFDYAARLCYRIQIA
jgi:hypothetical protein